jgi:hypothetical protein
VCNFEHFVFQIIIYFYVQWARSLNTSCQGHSSPRRLRQYTSLKRRSTSTRLYGAMFQKVLMFILILSSHLHLGLPSFLFASGFKLKFCIHFSSHLHLIGVLTTPASYSGGLGIKFRPRFWLLLLRSFVYFLSASRQIPKQCLKLNHNLFLPHLFN